MLYKIRKLLNYKYFNVFMMFSIKMLYNFPIVFYKCL
jgi:hypothetical protein